MSVESALRVVAERHGYTEIKDKQKDAVLSFTSGKTFLYRCPPATTLISMCTSY